MLLNEQPAEAARYDSEHQEQVRKKVEHLNGTLNLIDDATGTLTDKFTVNEVATICKKLQNNKAAGYDCITYESLKYGGYELYTKLTYLYNNIIQYMHIPAALKHSMIIPIYKGKQKPRTSVNSYRGVSLTLTLNKILEKLVLDRLTPWLATRNFPPPLQQAGRRGTNCVCLSYVVQEAIGHITHQHSKVYGCFLDIKSAYDVINWDGLLLKLANLGIRHKLWHFFQRWLRGSTAQVLVQGVSSNTFEISRSIKQGGLLSTLFFVVLYHDIHHCVIQGNTQALTFHNIDIGSPTMADDTLLLSLTVNGLQIMIDNAFRYGRKWRLEYSSSKTKCITFGETKRQHECNSKKRQWHMGTEPLEEVTSYNYLGIILSANGLSRERTDAMTRKGYSCFGILKATGFHSDGLSPITCSTLWLRMLVPSMLYGCEVWGNLPKREINSLELVQKKIGKHIQGLHRRTHDEIVRGLLGWTTIAGLIDKCKLNFLYKLISLPSDSFVKRIFLCQIYCMLISPATANQNSLTYNLWSVARKYDMQKYISSYLTGGPIMHKGVYKQMSKSAVHDVEEQKWKVGLVSKNANRFLNIHNSLTTHFIYSVIRNHMFMRKRLLNIIKLSAFPEITDDLTCEWCNMVCSDMVDHYIIHCEGLIDIRSEFWDKVLDSVQCTAEADLLNRDQDDLLEILLGKKWNTLDSDQQITFTCCIANNINSLMFVL